MIPYRPARHKRLARALTRSVLVALSLEAVLDSRVDIDCGVSIAIVVGGFDGGGVVGQWIGESASPVGDDCRGRPSGMRRDGAALASLPSEYVREHFVSVDASQARERFRSRDPPIATSFAIGIIVPVAE